MKKILFKYLTTFLFSSTMLPELAHATQMHSASEGVVVHQIGHLFFLISMVILYFTIQGKQLYGEKGWRSIQFSALFFVLWNMDALLVHFFDNQLHIVSARVLSMQDIQIESLDGSRQLSVLYYFLRLDHLLCLPGMICLWRGVTVLLKNDALSHTSPMPLTDKALSGSEAFQEPESGREPLQ